MKEIYLDNSATTRICPEALDKYVQVARENYGNPSSRHFRGQAARAAMEEARAAVLASLGAKNGKLLFTSGGTEANNLAILGRAHAKERYKKGCRILTTAGEHSSVGKALLALKTEGFDIVEIPTAGGVLDLDALAAAANEKTVLCTMMMVNNETGAVYPVKEAAAILHRASPDAVLHVDATQSYMKIPFTPASLGADMITLSSHKIEGPKGVGALWVSDAVIKNRGLSPVVFGGGQEDGLRSGTENVPGICAFGEAARVYHGAFAARTERVARLRGYLVEKIATLDGCVCNLPPVCAPHILNITVRGLRSETVLNDLSGRGICVSSGSACSSHDKNALSGALLAFGKTADEADSSIRVSLSYHNTEEELDTFVSALGEIIATRAKKR